MTIRIDPRFLATADRLASAGLSLRDIAAGLKVSNSWLHARLSAAKAGTGTPEDADLLDCIQGAQMRGQMSLVESLIKNAKEGDSRAATWLLSHAPSTRGRWSEAAAVRRESERLMGVVGGVVQDAKQRGWITPDAERLLLLSLGAAGLRMERIHSGDLAHVSDEIDP